MSWLALAIVAALAFHEAGHAAVAQTIGLPWRPTLTRHGPGIVIGSDAIRLGRRQIMATAAGGPLANLVLAAVGFELGVSVLVLTSLELAVLSLLPFRRSDGSRIIRALAMSDSHPTRRRRKSSKRAGTNRKRSGMKLRTHKGQARTPTIRYEEAA